MGLNASIKEWDGPEKDVASIFSSALMANPVDFPIYFPAESMEDTHIRWGGKSGAPNGSYVNPVADYVSGYSSYSQTTVVANLRINQKLDMFVKGLEFSALISYKNRELFRKSSKKETLISMKSILPIRQLVSILRVLSVQRKVRN